MGGCQRIVPSTDQENRDLVRYYGASGETITVIPCGANLDFCKSVNSELTRHHLGHDGQGVMLFVGRIHPITGIDKLLTSMSCLETKRNKLANW